MYTMRQKRRSASLRRRGSICEHGGQKNINTAMKVIIENMPIKTLLNFRQTREPVSTNCQ